MDVKSAHSHAPIGHEIYVKQSEGYQQWNTATVKQVFRFLKGTAEQKYTSKQMTKKH